MASLTMSLFTVLSRVAMDEFSFSDVEELLRKQGTTKQVMPRLERFAEHLRDHVFAYRLIDFAARCVAAVAAYHCLCVIEDPSPVCWVFFALAMAVFVLLADVVIRPVAMAYAERLTLVLHRFWPVLPILLWIPVRPFYYAANLVQHLVSGGEPETPEEQAEDEIMAAVSLSEATGQIEEQERDMIESVLSLGTLTVEKLMTPRTEMHAVNLEEGTAGVVAQAKDTGHSRLPVYDGNRDNILGILYVKDLIGLDPAQMPPLPKLLRPAVFVPASKKVDDLLGEFRRNRVHLAIVLDEYGGTAGLISIEDIIEEVFGDIDDEYDEIGEVEVRALADSTFDLDARMHVEEVNERFEANLPESEAYESLGGLLTTSLGRIPGEGLQWESDAWRLTVLEATDRRVVRVRLERIDLQQAQSA